MSEVNSKTEPEKLYLTEYMTEHGVVYQWDGTEFEKFPSFRCRSDDVWVCSYPRSGTTLTQQLVYLIMTLDFEKAVTIDLNYRFPHAEPYSQYYDHLRGLSHLDDMPTDEPRMIKSHMHYCLLPDELKKGKGRVVYITRNPKSSVSSLYRVLKYIKNPPADSLNEYIEMFLSGKQVYACPWGLHVRQYWEHRNDPNILFVQFEKLIKDRKYTIRQIAEFLGRDLTDEHVDKIFEYTTIESMKSNNAVNFFHFESLHTTDRSHGAFINTGEVSGWKKDMPEDLSRRFDEFIQREIGDTDIKFE